MILALAVALSYGAVLFLLWSLVFSQGRRERATDDRPS
jgi:hypothetical protein